MFGIDKETIHDIVVFALCAVTAVSLATFVVGINKLSRTTGHQIAQLPVGTAPVSPSPDVDTRLYAGVCPFGQIWVSDDKDGAWQDWDVKADFRDEIINNNYAFCVFGFGYDPYHDTVVAGTGAQQGPGQIWISDDGGESWSLSKDLYTDNPHSRRQCYVRDFVYVENKLANPPLHRLISGGKGPDHDTIGAQIWGSDDGGRNWRLLKDFNDITDENGIPTVQDIRAFTYDSENNTIIAGSGIGQDSAQIYISEDYGETWHRTLGIYDDFGFQGEGQIGGLAYDSQFKTIVAGTTGSAQIWISADGGHNWRRVVTLSDKQELPGAPLSRPRRVYSIVYDSYHKKFVAVTGWGSPNDVAQVWTSSNGGYNWDFVADLHLSDPPADSILASGYDSNNHMVITGGLGPKGDKEAGYVWTSTDGGVNWDIKKDFSEEMPNEQLTITIEVDAIPIKKNNPPVISVVNNTPVPQGQTRLVGINAIDIDGDFVNLTAAYAGSQLNRTPNSSGLSFFTYNRLPGMTYAILQIDSGNVVAGQSLDVYISANDSREGGALLGGVDLETVTLVVDDPPPPRQPGQPK